MKSKQRVPVKKISIEIPVMLLKHSVAYPQKLNTGREWTHANSKLWSLTRGCCFPATKPAKECCQTELRCSNVCLTLLMLSSDHYQLYFPVFSMQSQRVSSATSKVLPAHLDLDCAQIFSQVSHRRVNGVKNGSSSSVQFSHNKGFLLLGNGVTMLIHFQQHSRSF